MKKIPYNIHCIYIKKLNSNQIITTSINWDFPPLWEKRWARWDDAWAGSSTYATSSYTVCSDSMDIETYRPNSVMCGMCIHTCSFKPNRKNISQEQHLAKLGNVLLTPPPLRNRRNNDAIHTCGTVTTTNMAECVLPRQWKVYSFIVHGTLALHMRRKMLLDIKNINRIRPLWVNIFSLQLQMATLSHHKPSLTM